MSFSIFVNGQPFIIWETATLRRSIDDNCGSFKFTNSSTVPGQPYPVKEGDLVGIKINGILKLTGYVDGVSTISDSDQHTVTVIGRDTTADIIDSSVPNSAKVIEGPITLKSMMQKVIAGLKANIAVIDDIDPDEFTDKDLQAASSGGNAMDFLVSFSRKRQVYLVSDGDNSLVIFSPGESTSSTSLIRKVNNQTNNVKSSSSRFSSQGRYNKVVCTSADNFGNNASADYSVDGTSRTGESIDSGVRESRYLEIQAEETMGDIECTQRANEEVNLRRARGNEYTAKVAGYAQSSGALWDFGQLVNVDDEYANVRGQLLIRAVEMFSSIQGGSTTSILCASPDAYNVVGAVTRGYSRKSSFGEDLSV